jgi:hypothetical protein
VYPYRDFPLAKGNVVYGELQAPVLPLVPLLTPPERSQFPAHPSQSSSNTPSPMEHPSPPLTPVYCFSANRRPVDMDEGSRSSREEASASLVLLKRRLHASSSSPSQAASSTPSASRYVTIHLLLNLFCCRSQPTLSPHSSICANIVPSCVVLLQQSPTDARPPSFHT